MSLPKVEVIIKNGGLGGVAFGNDGIAGLIVSGAVAPDAGWPLGTAKQFFSIDEVKEAGLDAQYDTDNSTNAYAMVAQFFTVTGDGAELWVMVVPPTETMEDIADPAGANAYAKKLLEAAGGVIRLLGITRVPDGAYVPAYTKGIDDDVIAALTKAEALADAKAAEMNPVVILVEGRDYQGDTGTLEDLSGLGFNRVAGVIASDKADGSAAVGLLLGRLAADPVMRKAGRVKTGAIPITDGYWSDGEKVTRGVAESLNTLGWIVMTPYPQRRGFYWGVDNTCSGADDDFSTITNRRVIDKAMMIAYDTYITEIMDEVAVDAEGKIDPGIIKQYEGKITNAVNGLMTANGEISSMQASIDPAQNVLSTGKIVVKMSIVPVGYAKVIQVNLGFTNPASA